MRLEHYRENEKKTRENWVYLDNANELPPQSGGKKVATNSFSINVWNSNNNGARRIFDLQMKVKYQKLEVKIHNSSELMRMNISSSLLITL